MSLLAPLPPGLAPGGGPCCPPAPLPASGPSWGVGALEQPQGALAGPGFPDWMTERADFCSLLTEPAPPAPLSDLEAMASLLKRELEQLEDFFLAEAPEPPGPFPFPWGAELPLSPPTPEPLGLAEPLPAPASKGDRRQKKRDQNKTAALRYRQRKRAESEALGEQCQSLEARNRQLREEAASIEREIQYVKDLLIEVYKARRLRAS